MTFPVIVGHDTATFQFPAGFVFSSDHPTLDPQVNIVIANFNKCMVAKRPDIAYTLVFSLQTVSGLADKALSQALHAGGAWTPTDGTNYALLTNEFSNQAGPHDLVAEFKALGLQNLHGPHFGHK